MSNKRDVKQVIVIRKDLKMRRGKEVAQGAHASMWWLLERLKANDYGRDEGFVFFDEVEQYWIEEGCKKVVCVVDTETELRELEAKALKLGFEAYLIVDSGLTEFDGVPTVTALGIGPALSSDLDAVTGHLKLY